MLFIIRKNSLDSLFSRNKMEDNEIDLSCIMPLGDDEIIVIFCPVSLGGGQIFGACVLLEVE